jgi:hypothetical protein
MVDRTFTNRGDIPEAKGFRVGQRVTLLEQTIGCDHEDIEHTISSGSDGVIEAIEFISPKQGFGFTIWIPVNELEGRGIVNVFDEHDGPITNFIKIKEAT